MSFQHDMREQRMALMFFAAEHPGRLPKRADQILRTLVRENDAWGISESGDLYLMLVQTDSVSTRSF